MDNLLKATASELRGWTMRVGIEFAFRDQGWLGGVNGIANLLRALSTLSDPRVQPVLIANPNTPAQLFEGLPDVEILRTGLIDAGTRLHLARRISKRAIGRDPLMERWLQSKKIDILSHCESLGPKSAIPTIGQIADFGYKYFPKLYADAAWRRMDAGTARICDQHAVIMMPSRAVVDDYRKFFPDARAKGVYLHQIPSAPPHGAAPDSATLRRRYTIRERIFYTPNQFWVHKNHSVIIDALALLAERGKDVHVVSTGAKTDDRRPHYFEDLMRHAAEKGVEDRFHVLGVIPFVDTIGLMRDCMAVVQSSLFEGWGLTVAEARFMGKTVILTDIPVFREQAPDYGVFFDSKSASALADAMASVADVWSPEEDARRRSATELKRPAALDAYARGYEEIVMEAGRGG
jgi:glycosyltransferase involved in cell wall biosynthesis